MPGTSVTAMGSRPRSSTSSFRNSDHVVSVGVSSAGSTGVAGNVLSLANGPQVISFGASGGIFGLLAGVVSFDLVTNEKLNPSLIIWFATIFVFSSFLFSYVDWLVHAGGALLGLALGYVLGVRKKTEPLAI